VRAKNAKSKKQATKRMYKLLPNSTRCEARRELDSKIKERKKGTEGQTRRAPCERGDAHKGRDNLTKNGGKGKDFLRNRRNA